MYIVYQCYNRYIQYAIYIFIRFYQTFLKQGSLQQKLTKVVLPDNVRYSFDVSNCLDKSKYDDVDRFYESEDSKDLEGT